MSKIKKQQKPLGGFELNKLDNTASVKKIIEDIQFKNVNAYKLYTKVLGRAGKTSFGDHWSLVGHPISKFPDNWDGDLSLEYFEQFTYKGTMPKYITPMKNMDKSDPLTSYMKAKSDWTRAMDFMNIRSESFAGKYEKLNDEVAYCPQHIVNMVIHHHKDPDPNFDSLYNWYYAGHGNMQLLILNYNDYLLYSEFTCLYLSEFLKEDVKVSPEKIFTFDCGKGNNILETIFSINNIIALRTKYKIFILKIISQEENIEIEKLKELPSKTAYTSISFDSYHTNILYVTKLDNSLTIVNLDRMTGRNVKLRAVESLLDNWSCVLSADRSYYTHVGPDTMTVYDKRTNTASGEWGKLRDITDTMCSKVSAARKYDNCMYLGSSHHLFSLDIRCCSDFKPNFLQRWTHNMISPPTYICKSYFETNKDLICLSSQWCEDMCLIVSDSKNISNGQDPLGVSLPYHPPSMLKTLKEARFKLMCGDVYIPLDSRIQTTITGTLLLDKDDKYIILMQNSLGDISSHIIYPAHLDIFMENDSPEMLHEWSKGYAIEPELFEVSNVVDIARVLKKLKKIPEDTSYFDGEIVGDCKFSEKEVFKTFSSEEIDSGLLEAWGFSEFENNDDGLSIS